MMNYIGLFSAAIFFLSMFSGCAVDSEKLVQVSSEGYGTPQCWLSESQELEAFLVAASEDGVVVPYLISSRCLVSEDYTSQGEATLHHLNAVRVSDSRGTLRRALKVKAVVDNVSTDQPLPSSTSKVYYIRGHVNQQVYTSMTVYNFTDIINLYDSNLSFERFLEFNGEGRQSLRDKYKV